MFNLLRKFATINFLAPIILGLIVCYIYIGPKILNPGNDLWLLRGESLEDYLGWVFYRNTPWLWPVGLNPNYGLEISSSIVFSDSIPLFSLIFKTFESVLPAKFQYFGIWILFCYVMQSIVAWKIVSLYSNSLCVKFLGTLLYLVSLPMIWRIGDLQTALAGHFLILVGLYLNLNPNQNFRAGLWLITLLAASLIHFYLFSMVAILWLANLCDLLKIGKIKIKNTLIEIGAFAFVIFVFLFQSGYFVISNSSASEWGYGQFNLNLLSFFTPRDWSSIYSTRRFSSDGESFNYLGLGIIILFSITFIFALFFRRKKIVEFTLGSPFFVLCIAALFIYALSNKISVGNWSYTVLLPNELLNVINVLRHSNRFFWPVYYFLLTASIIIILSLKNNRVACVLFLSIGIIQIYDTSAGWMPLRNSLMSPAPPEDGEPLVAPFWSDASIKYKNIVRVPMTHKAPSQWGVWARYAANNKMATNSASFARVDQDRLIGANKKYLDQLSNGNFDQDTLYIIDEWKNLPISINFDKSRDLLARIDGYNVLAPGWKKCEGCFDKYPELEVSRLAPQIYLNQPIPFNRDSFGRKSFLLEGWSWPGESWGTWSDSNNAKILLPMPVDGYANTIDINLRAFIFDKIKAQKVKIFINEFLIKEVDLLNSDTNLVRINIPASVKQSDSIKIEFKFLNAVKPVDIIPGSKDDRLIAIGLMSLTLRNIKSN